MFGSWLYGKFLDIFSFQNLKHRLIKNDIWLQKGQVGRNFKHGQTFIHANEPLEAFISMPVGKQTVTNYSSTLQVIGGVAKLDSSLSTKTSVFRGTEKCLPCQSLTAFIASQCRRHMFDPSCVPGNQPSTGGMCLEVERGAAGWPLVIWVMWDKAGSLGQVEGVVGVHKILFLLVASRACFLQQIHV